MGQSLFKFKKLKNKREKFFRKQFNCKISFQVQKVKNKRENYFSKYFEWNRIYMGQSVFKFKKLKNKREKSFKN